MNNSILFQQLKSILDKIKVFIDSVFKNIKYIDILTIWVFLVFNYNFKISFFLAFAGSIILISLLWKNATNPKNIGLQIRNLSAFLFSSIFATCAFFAFYLIYKSNNFVVFGYSKRIIFHVVFYTLNEELILGYWLFRKFYNYIKSNVKIIILASFIFSVLHYISYKYIFDTESGSLSFLSIANLFLISIVRYWSIYKFNSIWVAYSLHLCFMVCLFGAKIYKSDMQIISHVDLFNNFIGSVEMLIILGVSILILGLKKIAPSKKVL